MLLTHYQPGANDCQQLFYVFCVVCLVASIVYLIHIAKVFKDLYNLLKYAGQVQLVPKLRHIQKYFIIASVDLPAEIVSLDLY